MFFQNKNASKRDMHIFVPIYATVPKMANHVSGKQETPF